MSLYCDIYARLLRKFFLKIKYQYQYQYSSFFFISILWTFRIGLATYTGIALSIAPTKLRHVVRFIQDTSFATFAWEPALAAQIDAFQVSNLARIVIPKCVGCFYTPYAASVHFVSTSNLAEIFTVRGETQHATHFLGQ